LKKRVTQQLEGHARTKAETAMRKELEAIIKEKYQFEVPASLTLKEKQSRLKHELSHVNKADLTPEKKKEIEAKVSKEVEGTYRLMFINQKVATDHKLNVTSAELTQEYMKQLYMVPEDERIIDQSMEQENIQSRLYTHLLFLKAIDYLLDHATKK
jgi:trigger factor